MSNIIRSWNGKSIRQREDGYLSATDMCQSVGKFFADWMRLKSTHEYLQALESDMGIPISDLVVTVKGNFANGVEQGSWVHRLVSIDLAQWCSVQLRIQCNKWIEELLLKGYVSINQPEPVQPQLPPSDIRVTNLVNAIQYSGIDVSNPRFSQSLKDMICDILGFNQNALPPQTDEKWLGCVERAEQLGYSIALITKYRSVLGRFVKASGLEYREEDRLCNGTERSIKLYRLTAELDNVIKEYMDAKVLAS